MYKLGSKHVEKLVLPLLLGDSIIILGAWFGGYLIRFGFDPSTSLNSAELANYALASLILLVFYLTIALEAGIYGRLILVPLLSIALKLFVILVITNSLWASFLFFTRFSSFSRIQSLIFSLLAFLLLILLRAALYRKFKGSQAPGSLTKAIFIAETDYAKECAEKIAAKSELAIEIIGFVGSRKIEPYLGPVADLESIIASTNCSEIFVMLDAEHKTAFSTVENLMLNQHLDLNYVFGKDAGNFINPELIKLGEVSILAASQPPLFGINALVKRALDILFSSILIIISLPLWFILMIGIKLSSKGPVFYRQERMGLDGEIFEILKLRSMPLDSESVSGAKWAVAGDKRATKIGALMRKTSLDETPQFINVLLGHMSLVGPRPERPEFIAEFRHQIPYYMSRHKIKAGITGWAQVNGWRGNTSLHKRIEHDLFYINNWSLLLDIKILFLTLIYGFINKNAY